MIHLREDDNNIHLVDYADVLWQSARRQLSIEATRAGKRRNADQINIETTLAFYGQSAIGEDGCHPALERMRNEPLLLRLVEKALQLYAQPLLIHTQRGWGGAIVMAATWNPPPHEAARMANAAAPGNTCVSLEPYVLPAQFSEAFFKSCCGLIGGGYSDGFDMLTLNYHRWSRRRY